VKRHKKDKSGEEVLAAPDAEAPPLEPGGMTKQRASRILKWWDFGCAAALACILTASAAFICFMIGSAGLGWLLLKITGVCFFLAANSLLEMARPDKPAKPQASGVTIWQALRGQRPTDETIHKLATRSLWITIVGSICVVVAGGGGLYSLVSGAHIIGQIAKYSFIIAMALLLTDFWVRLLMMVARPRQKARIALNKHLPGDHEEAGRPDFAGPGYGMPAMADPADPNGPMGAYNPGMDAQPTGMSDMNGFGPHGPDVDPQFGSPSEGMSHAGPMGPMGPYGTSGGPGMTAQPPGPQYSGSSKYLQGQPPFNPIAAPPPHSPPPYGAAGPYPGYAGPPPGFGGPPPQAGPPPHVGQPYGNQAGYPGPNIPQQPVGPYPQQPVGPYPQQPQQPTQEPLKETRRFRRRKKGDDGDDGLNGILGNRR